MKKDKFRVPKTIKARNKWFNGLGVEDKRVAVAKDVLEQLDLKKFVAEEGTYFYLESKAKEGESLQKVIDKGESCSVCAMGAVFASKVRLGNDCNITDDILWDSCIKTGDEEVLKHTEDIFSERTMRLMEWCFEGVDIVDFFWDDYKLEERVDVFRISYKTSDSLIRAIMQNIIDNKGEFVI